MRIETQAKRNAKEILLRYGISEPTLENVIFIIEEHGYELLEYNTMEPCVILHIIKTPS